MIGDSMRFVTPQNWWVAREWADSESQLCVFSSLSASSPVTRRCPEPPVTHRVCSAALGLFSVESLGMVSRTWGWPFSIRKCDNWLPVFPLAEAPSCMTLGSSSLSGPSIHCPSAAVCIGILPGLGAYSGSSDSESSSDSEGTINATGKIVSSIFRTNTFLEAP